MRNRTVPDAFAQRCVLKGIVFVCILLCFCLSGCGDGIKEASVAEMEEFQSIGASCPTVDMDSLVKAKIAAGPYRVLPGEVLQLTMPAILQVVTSKKQDFGNEVQPYLARVSDEGTITLPAVGDILVAGHSLTEIEAAVTHAYYPAYAKKKPSVYVEVAKPRLYRVSIVGAVSTPGIYELRADEMSLVNLLMKAGGIVNEGAARIRIDRSNSATGLRRSVAAASVSRQPQGGTSTGSVSLAGYSPAADPQHDVKLSFRPQSTSGSIGRLVISRHGALLVDERIDLASEAQRYSVLAKAVRADTTISMVNLGKKLSSLLYTLSIRTSVQRGIRLARVDGASTQLKRLDSGHIQLGDGTILSNNIAEEDVIPEPVADSQTTTLTLPVKGLNVPFADIALYEGDDIVVEKLVLPRFSVLGLVKNEGLFPYPPATNYSLIEAIALAGGLDTELEPRWAVVYRLNGDGTIASQAVNVAKMNKDKPALSAMNLIVKPGDIIALEHTKRTRRTKLLKSIFKINMGMYVPIIR